MAVKFQLFEVRLQLFQRKKLKSFIESIFIENQKRLKNLNYIFCTDDFLLKINQNFLKHDFFTDIITFDLSENSSRFIEAEIYISIDRIKENADIFKTNFQLELHRVIFHGALHLCGFNDKTKKEKTLMKNQEDYYLKKYFN